MKISIVACPKPRICAPQPHCGPVRAFPRRGGNVPLPGSGGDVGPRCGNGKRPVPVILNAVKNPSSPLRANRDVARRTEAVGRILRLRCAPLRMTAMKGLCGNAARDVLRYWQSSPFPSACAICPLGVDTAPAGRGMRKQDKRRVLTPAPATPDGRADRENGSFSRLSASACWICTKSQNLLSYTPEV